jgi:pilus assembly protein CpaE
MGLREDTVVSRLPDFTEDESTRVERGTGTGIRADRAIAALGHELPSLGSKWGSAGPGLKVVRPEMIKTIGHTPRPQRARPPAPPRVPPAPPRAPSPPPPAGKVNRPLPLPDFEVEPSVVEMIPQPPRPQLEVVAEAAPIAAPAAGGKVIVLFGCRGGAGSTTLAVNTAASLARVGKKVCVVDLDLQLGDVFVALDLAPSTSLAAVAREASTIDAAALVRRLARHDAGIYALGQTGAVDDIDGGLAERIPALMSTLCDHFDHVIVDGVRDFGDCALSVLDMADEIAMVLTQDVASVRRAARAVTLFRRLGYSDSKMRLVLNRTTRKAAVPAEAVTRALGLPVTASVRNDFKRVNAALNDGALLGEVARGKGVARDVEALATALGGAAPTRSQKKGLLARLKGGN